MWRVSPSLWDAKSRESCWGSEWSRHHQALSYRYRKLLFSDYTEFLLLDETGGPDPPVLSGRAPIFSVFPKRGVARAQEQLQKGCCPFLVLWHHPVAAGRGLSLPCHRHASLAAGVSLGTQVVPRASSAASAGDSVASFGEEVSRSLLSPANWRGGQRGERAAAGPDPPLKFAPCAPPAANQQ